MGAIVSDLEPRLAIDADAAPTGGRGRPGHRVALRRAAVVGLGLEVNVDYVAAVLLDLSGEVLRVEVRSVDPHPPSGNRDQHEVFGLARDVLDGLDHDQSLAGVTVAVPGLVGRDARTVAWAPNVGWEGQELGDRLDATLADVLPGALAPGCVVEVLNDANCAALAEVRHGAARDVDDVVYLTGTVGIGAGIVLGGRLVRGGSGFAGEVGHMPLGRARVRCGCGRTGCWEASVGLLAMLRAVDAEELETPIRSAEKVAERARSEVVVRRALAELGHDLGLGLATLTNMLDPSVLVLGGYFVPLGESVMGPARAVLGERLVPTGRRPPDLRWSQLDIHAAATGAAERSLERVLTGEVSLGPASRVRLRPPSP